MTTLVALASKEALVMGTDSLGTVTRHLVDPFDLIEYFDGEDDLKMRLDEDGKPLLGSFLELFQEAQSVPYNQLGNVTKLFDLAPLPMGAMFTGVTSIGNRTIGGLIAEFKERDQVFRQAAQEPSSSDDPSTGGSEQSNYTVSVVSDRLRKMLRQYYASTFPNEYFRPDLELVIGGYDNLGHLPRVFRIDVKKDEVYEIFSDEIPFGIAFGGQMDWMQRIVWGTDDENRARLAGRANDLLNRYYDRICEAASAEGVVFDVPKPDSWGDELDMFADWDIRGLDANFGDFSEQNAIDCVDFFVEIMIRAQAVSSQLPTVGGDVHIAVIRKDGFRFVSRQEWTHRDHRTEIPGVRQ